MRQGMPLPGVAVIQKGTTFGAATDVDGRFEFKLTEKERYLGIFICWNEDEGIVV